MQLIQTRCLLFIIFLLAVFIRFLYFPNNIYFGFDQARDAYAALEITRGDIKIIGPSTSFEELYHGVLYYYFLAPLYLISRGNPEFVSLVMRLLNASGVFLIFYLGRVLFNKNVGLVSAFLFAISFEQSQFSIYMGNPSLASLFVPLMYLGLALVIFVKKYYGLILAFLGLGLSIQMQFALLYLVLPFGLIILFFRKTFLKTPVNIIIKSLIIFLFTISSFLLAEIKYNFRTFHALFNLSSSNADRSLPAIINSYTSAVSRMSMYNIFGNLPSSRLYLLIVLLIIIYLTIKQKKNLQQLIFLGIWFFAIFSTFIVQGGTDNINKNIPLYYPNIGVSISLIILVAYALSLLQSKVKLLLLLILVFIAYLNLNLIFTYNPKGTISEINVQQGMLLSDEKKVIDYIYNDTKSNPFAIKGVTMPFYINTTWSYLFEWYGKNKYGYLPVWNGKNAYGYPGNLEVKEYQETLPPKRYLIIEPVRGVPQYLIDDYIKEENYFTKVISNRRIGEFLVEKRERF